MADEAAPIAAVEDELLEAPARGSADELLDAGASGHLGRMRHSAAHVMADAVMRLFPGVKLGIGPAIADGFYYDFLLERALTPDDLVQIEATMATIVADDHTFKLDEYSFEEAREALVRFEQPLKIEIMDDLKSKAEREGKPAPRVTTYRHGNFQDLCRGPHVESTGKIGPFKLLSVAGAYWRGKSDRPMLQRIYGTAWDTKEELEDFLWRRDEMKKRDHRRLGVALDLFSFHDVSPGSAFWHPKGQLLWRTLEGAMRDLQLRRGYDEISTPIVVSKRLWEQSGHWDLYRENMFLIESEGEEYSLKPMNCPESTVIYKTRTRSYRDLPLRLAEYGRLHRNELSGTLSGLTRVRHFIQDDAHVFVRPDQIESEVEALLGEVAEVYGWFGLPVEFVFSTKPAKALGDPALWAKAEAMIEVALKRSGSKWRLNAGDGAFYAPKIDILVKDALGREWQTATIQVDLVMLPERFDLAYVDEAGERVRPIAIHRAIYGSLERFIGILVEHYAGAFPFWLAPEQVTIIPITDRHEEAATHGAKLLRAVGIRARVDASSARMQNKIRLAQEQKVPLMLVVGDKEIEAGGAAPRWRDGTQEPAQSWEALAATLSARAAARGA